MSKWLLEDLARSEHANANSGENTGRVKIIEPLGNAILVFFQFGKASRLVAKVVPELNFA